MATYKSVSAWAENVSGSFNALIPPYANNDVAIMIVAGISAAVPAPSGWTQRGVTNIEGSLYWSVFDRVLTGSQASTTTVSVPTVSGGGAFVILYSDASAGVTFEYLDDNTSDTYGILPTFSGAGSRLAVTIIYGARSTYTAGAKIALLTGTATATATERQFSSILGNAYRAVVSTIDATAAASALYGQRWGGGNSSSNGMLITVPDYVVPDSTAPAVFITAPAAGVTLTGVVTFTATITDAIGVASASLVLGGSTPFAMTNTSGNIWSATVDTVGVANGATTLVVSGVDAAGNVGTTSRSLSVSNQASTISVWNGSAEVVQGTLELREWWHDPDAGMGGGDELGFWYPKQYGTSGETAVKMSYWDGSAEHPVTIPDTSSSVPYEGLDWMSYGDSSGVVQSGTGGIDYNASQVWCAQLAQSFAATSHTNRHVNSSTACDVFERMNRASGGAPWVPGSADFVTVHVGGNEMLHTPTMAGVDQYGKAVLAIMSLLHASSRILATSATASTGTWQTVTASSRSSGGGLGSEGVGATLTFTFTGDRATILFLSGIAETNSDFSYSVDGGPDIHSTTKGTFDDTLIGIWWVPVPIILTGLGAGSHTVTITKETTGVLVVDSLLPWQSDIANVPYFGMPQPPPFSELLDVAGTPPPNAVIEAYSEKFWEVRRLFPDMRKKIVFSRKAQMYQMSDNDMVIGDGYHPNLKGHTGMKNAFRGSIINSGAGV